MLGIIGGSGIYEALGFENSHEDRVETPFGSPSAPLEIGEVGDPKGVPTRSS